MLGLAFKGVKENDPRRAAFAGSYKQTPSSRAVTNHIAANMPYNIKVGDPISALDTPSMIVDLDLMETNIDALFSQLLPMGVNIRPHSKTTKSAVLAKKLIAAGAKGACVAKLSEAEVMCAKGVTDILITCEIVGPAKVKRLVDLFRSYKEIRIVVDSEEGARAIDAAIGDAGIVDRILTLIDLDVGLHRTGVEPGEPALQLAKTVAGLKHLKLIGVQGYEGHLQHLHGFDERRRACLESMKILVDTAEAFRKEGLQIGVVTTGGTGTAEFCAAVKGSRRSSLAVSYSWTRITGTRWGQSTRTASPSSPR